MKMNFLMPTSLLVTPGEDTGMRLCAREQGRAPTAPPSPRNGERAGVRGETVRVAQLTPRVALLLCLSFLLLHFVLNARADLPAPDSLLYGSVTLGVQLLTATDTNILIEARKTLAGPAVSSYRMGAEPDAGNFYVLKVPLEELAPLVNPTNSLVGNTIFLVVRDLTGPRATNTFQITERGLATRLDFGTDPNGDTDGDGLPDAWELARFGNLNRNGTSLGANGQTLAQNYTAGTDPNNPNDQFHLAITQAAQNKFVSFLARVGAGAGYEGKSRYYALEYTTNAMGPWLGVPNRTNILGNNFTNTYQSTEVGAHVFYRGRVRLQSP